MAFDLDSRTPSSHPLQGKRSSEGWEDWPRREVQRSTRGWLPTSAQVAISLLYTRHTNIASYPYPQRPTQSHIHVYTCGHSPSASNGCIHKHVHTHSHIYIHTYKHTRLPSYLCACTRTHTQTYKTAKTKKLVTGISKIASLFLDTSHRKIQVGRREMTPHPRFPSRLLKDLLPGASTLVDWLGFRFLGPWRAFEPCGKWVVYLGWCHAERLSSGDQKVGLKMRLAAMHRRASEHRGREERPVVNISVDSCS